MHDIESLLPPSLGRYLRAPKIAEAFGCSVEAVRLMARRGDIPAPIKVTDRLFLFDRLAILDALRRRQEGGAA